ncbi:arsenate reductase family protein [Lewinella sp. IMCC34183]|uniref:arsenate reductase family protein n=1 Tax=Lewinella sp. IMCC34183 TaxID=2248762 RepID=UPI000E21E2CB|nr:ArsC/Spx/MgsR family protein [Lewinella sp. IMCC34183]
MAKLFHLGTCSTCRRLLGELDPPPHVEQIDIKKTHVTPEDLDRMAALAGGYAPLFNRRARKYQSAGLAERELTEDDYRRLILEEYTFLKRPVVLTDSAVYAGSAKATVAAARADLHS